MRRLTFASSLALLALSSCLGADPDHEDDFHGVEREPTGEVSLAATVGETATAGGCSTTAVFGLSEQINAVVNCLKPGILVAIPDRPNFKKSASTFAYMEKPAVDGLVAALDERTDMTLTANSILRNIASQYLLRAWFEAGQCGITAAAEPGKSNHETGQAIDTSDHAAWLTTLEKHGFKWLGAGDVVHFDYVGPGTVDLRPTTIEAFQRLWNHNNAGDKIAEDGLYGPMTEARLKQSPGDGFASVPPCGAGGAGGAGGSSGAPGAGQAGAPPGGQAGAPSAGKAGATSAGQGGAAAGAAQAGASGQAAGGEPAAGGAAQAGAGGAGGQVVAAGAGGAAQAGAGGAAGASGELVISRDDGGAAGGCGCDVPRGGPGGVAAGAALAFVAALSRARRRRR